MNEVFSVFTDLTPEQVPDDLLDFLQMLGGPTKILISGENPARTRAVVTLLHGNEPSGVRALHRFLKEGVAPPTNLLFLLGSVEASLIEPAFRHRFFPGTRDMNRCFNPPYDDAPGRIAEKILDFLDEYRPEAVIDIHNTSGSSPHFGVATQEDSYHESLIGLFTQKLVVSHLRLGSLMEQTRVGRPVVTVECGGAQDLGAESIAYRGLLRFAFEQELFNRKQDINLDLYHHPVRLELEQGTQLAFSNQPALGTELTLLADLDSYNFQVAPAGSLLGWVKDDRVHQRLRVVDHLNKNLFANYFEICGNRLQTRVALKLFMVTTRPDIALSDCLLYASFETEHETLHIHIDTDQAELI